MDSHTFSMKRGESVPSFFGIKSSVNKNVERREGNLKQKEPSTNRVVNTYRGFTSNNPMRRSTLNAKNPQFVTMINSRFEKLTFKNISYLLLI